eukprot:3522999-Rhodomonas_salina.2
MPVATQNSRLGTNELLQASRTWRIKLSRKQREQGGESKRPGAQITDRNFYPGTREPGYPGTPGRNS